MSLSQVKGNIVGKKIKEARQKLGLSQVEFAATLCVDYNVNLERVQISTIERGIRSVKDKELDAIARVLNVTPNWLMGW
ncbi:MAG: helix-turn-helix transcriptional regulator [Pseudomonadota bacterium]|nr:helix-turn-helix transcriptional regulator [Pseudomonadota bacterium]MDE3038796.1 helix-turn-helix transcriptional regulator [Pseudomonadota bacterium]